MERSCALQSEVMHGEFVCVSDQMEEGDLDVLVWEISRGEGEKEGEADGRDL